MKRIFLLFLSAITLLACKTLGNEDVPKSIKILNKSQLTQTVYADDNAGKSDVTFTTTGAWISEIKESGTVKSTRAAADWISISPSSGDKAGDYTISISLSINYTGEKRSATISIKCSDEIVDVVITQDAVTAAGEKPKPDPEPSGEGVLKNETTGESVKLTGVKHTIETPERVSIKFVGEGEKGGEFAAVFCNPLQNGKLRSGVYNIKLFNTYPMPEMIHGDCEWFKSSLAGEYGTSGTIKVELNNDTYTFTLDIRIGESVKLTGSFIGVPEYVNKEVKVASITLDETTKTLGMGDEFTLKATILPENATDKRYTWSSSNPTVATVSENGVVKSVSAGKTTITVTSTEGAKTAVCDVTVNKAVAVTGITVNPAMVTLLEGEYLDFYMEDKVTVLPKNATNKGFTWKSSDEKIAVYSGKGIEAKAAGVANIIFTTDDGAKTTSLKVTVTEREALGDGEYTIHDPNGKYEDQKYTLIQATHTIISKNRVELFFKNKTGDNIIKLRFNNPLSDGRLAAGSYTLSRNENPANGAVYHIDNYGNIGYFNSGNITVSISDNKYTFTTNNVGTTNGMTAALSYTGILNYTNEYVSVNSVSINKTSLSLTIGKDYKLEAIVNPDNAFNKKVTWSTSNANVASVSDNGYVYAKGVGTAKITVTTEDGAKTVTCQVTVTALPATGSGTFSGENNQSITIDRAEQWVNEKEPNEVEIRLAKPNSAYGNLNFTLARAMNDTGALKAGKYNTIRYLSSDDLGVKVSYENIGSAIVTLNGGNYTITLDVKSSDGVVIKGTYTGTIPII